MKNIERESQFAIEPSIDITTDEFGTAYAVEDTEIILSTSVLNASSKPVRYEWLKAGATMTGETKSFLRFIANSSTSTPVSGAGVQYTVKAYFADGSSLTSSPVTVKYETIIDKETVSQLFVPVFNEHLSMSTIHGVPERYIHMIDKEIWTDTTKTTRIPERNLQQVLLNLVDVLHDSKDAQERLDASYIYTLMLALQLGGRMLVVSSRDGYVSYYGIDLHEEHIINADKPNRIFMYKFDSMSYPNQPHFINWWEAPKV